MPAASATPIIYSCTKELRRCRNTTYRMMTDSSMHPHECVKLCRLTLNLPILLRTGTRATDRLQTRPATGRARPMRAITGTTRAVTAPRQAPATGRTPRRPALPTLAAMALALLLAPRPAMAARYITTHLSWPSLFSYGPLVLSCVPSSFPPWPLVTQPVCMLSL